ncbi:Uncharacterised protein [Escherichia coli]|nr:Uncharacterised protein [Escherichia coli]CTZ54452.1 Uncharacterised protein [Escherichia coli]
MKKQTWALLMFSSHQKHKLMQWKLRYLISQKMKPRRKLNHLYSVRGRSISSSQIRTEKNTVAQTNFLVWIRHWLLAPLKSQKKNILPEKMAHTRAYRKM